MLCYDRRSFTRLRVSIAHRESAVVLLRQSLWARPSVACLMGMSSSKLPDTTSPVLFVPARMSFLLHVRIVSQLRPQTRATAQRKHPQACETNQPLSFPPVWPPKALPPETDITSFNHIVAYTRSSLVESDPETFQLQTQCPIDQLS